MSTNLEYALDEAHGKLQDALIAIRNAQALVVQSDVYGRHARPLAVSATQTETGLLWLGAVRDDVAGR